MISSPASQENTNSQSGALANIIELARLSRFTLLYHGAAATFAGVSREQAAALASAAAVAAEGSEVVILFDASSDLLVPDLLANIEAAVLEAAPDAPLAPPMAGPVEALAFWQEALGMRFLLLMQRFDRALSRQDSEFDEVLLKLANGPLDISVLLMMDEAAAPLLLRLKDALPDLGETFLRLPEPAPAPRATSTLMEEDDTEPPVPAPAPATQAASAAPAAQFGPSPFLFDEPDDEPAGQSIQTGEVLGGMTLPAPPARQPETAQEDQPENQPDERQRRSRHFSSLLEQARIGPDAFDPPAEAAPEEFDLPAEAAPEAIHPPAPAGLFPAAPAMPVPGAPPLTIFPVAGPPPFAEPEPTLADGRTEPSFQAPPPVRPARPAVSAKVYRERRPMQVAAWMQKRRSRRRRDIVGMASRVGSSSTVLFVLMMVLAVLGWQMPQLGPPAGATPRAAAQNSAQPAQAVALRGNVSRRAISAASPAGAGRDTR
jgi:hypothetical protein